MERNPYFDNTRAVLIFLVVFGHMIQPFIDERISLHTMYHWIYTFHMPAFILISGFFAKGSSEKEYIWKLVKNLLAPYITFQIIYTAYYFWLGKQGWDVGLFYPHWSLWFLLSLFCWHLLLIPFKKLHPRIGLVLALALGIAAGYFNGIGHTFSLSRTLVFFPYFLIGYWLTEGHLLKLKKNRVKILSLISMIGVGALIHFTSQIEIGWLLGSKPYEELGVGWNGGFIRLSVYVVSFVMVISVLSWVPQRIVKGFTYIGTRTLYIYLLHGFFIQYFRQMELFTVQTPIDVLGITIVSILIVYLLSGVGQKLRINFSIKQLKHEE